MQFRPFFLFWWSAWFLFSFLPPGFSWGFNNLVGNLESFSEMCVLLNNKVSSVGMESHNFFQKKIVCLLHSHGLQRLSETVTQSNVSSKKKKRKKKTTQLFFSWALSSNRFVLAVILMTCSRTFLRFQQSIFYEGGWVSKRTIWTSLTVIRFARPL